MNDIPNPVTPPILYPTIFPTTIKTFTMTSFIKKSRDFPLANKTKAIAQDIVLNNIPSTAQTTK